MRRPDVFTLDYSHPLAQGLVFGGVNGNRHAVFDAVTKSKTKYSGVLQYAEYGREGLRLDGSSWLHSGVTPGLNNSFVDATISLWLSLPSLPPVQSFLFSNYKTFTAERSIAIVINGAGTSPSNSIMLYWMPNGTYSALNTYAVCQADEFIGDKVKHLTIIKSGEVGKCYIDGVLKNTFDLNGSASFATTTSYFVVGGRDNSGFAAVDVAAANILDVCIHNRALFPAEIALLADRTDPMLGGLIVEERPVLYYDMGGSTTDNLPTPDGIITTPSLASPALGQIHVLGGDGVAVTPVLGNPTLAQVHVLSAPTGITVTPTLGHPALTEISNTDALSQPDGITVTTSLGHPVLGQVHNLSAPDGITITATLGHPALTAAAGIDALPAPDGIVISPVLGSRAIGQVHVLGGDGITVTPALGHPLLGQVHALAGADGMSVTAVMGHPVLSALEVGPITADEVGRATTLQARNYSATLAKRNYTARL